VRRTILRVRRAEGPDVLYAFDRRNRFTGIFLNHADADLEHVHDLHDDRVARQRFTEHSVAEANWVCPYRRSRAGSGYRDVRGQVAVLVRYGERESSRRDAVAHCRP